MTNSTSDASMGVREGVGRGLKGVGRGWGVRGEWRGWVGYGSFFGSSSRQRVQQRGVVGRTVREGVGTGWARGEGSSGRVWERMGRW